MTLAVDLEGFGWSDPVTLPARPPALEGEDEHHEPSTTPSSSAADNARAPVGATPPAVTLTSSQQQRWRKRLGGGGGWRSWGAAARGWAEGAPVNVGVRLKDSHGAVLCVNAEVVFSACGLRQVRVCTSAREQGDGGGRVRDGDVYVSTSAVLEASMNMSGHR